MSGGPDSPQRWQRLESLFLQALESDPGARQALLDDRCGDDLALRREVEAMLAAHQSEAAPGIERKLVAASEKAPPDPLIATELGPYRIVERIGRGGMGLVYRAERLGGQFEQEVAIKIVRAAWLGSEMLERFGTERQILARLQHPNIATLLDGGVADNGLPYLVMQYVDGVPITRHCDEQRLPIGERLLLFRQVCDAVAFAHRHLIVHRDLKPSNILVTRDGRVQLLDFGIAKLLDPEAFGLDASMTRTEQRMLTPLHAAPEQLRGEAVTTATDVYALGLLLYELTSGRFPYRLERASSAAVQSAIRDTSPLRLTDALATPVPEELAPRRTDHLPVEEIAGLRRSRPGALRRELRGDLERVALMALRPEAERRYESAAQLAADVDRYLAGEPVRAHVDSLAYRARRFVARHRVATAAALLIALIVAGFSINAVLQAGRLRAERDRLAIEEQRSQAVIATLVDLFKSAAPETAQGDTVSLAAFLETAGATAEAMADRPAVQARLLFALGEMRAVRGEKRQARDLFERAWALERQIGEADTVYGQQVFHSLALMNLQMGELEIGRQQMRRSLDWHRAEFGELHTDVAQVMTDLARYLEPPEALPLIERALEIRRQVLPEGGIGIASTVNGLARLHADLGNRTQALALFRETLAMLEEPLGPNHPNYIIVLGNLTAQLASPEERLAAYDELIGRAEAVFGPQSVIVAGLHDHRGSALAELGRQPEAVESFERALEMAVAAGGETSMQAGRAARSLGWSSQIAGQYEVALAYYDTAVVAMSTDRSRAEVESLQAVMLSRLGRQGEALSRSAESLRLARASVGESGDDLVLAGNLARHGAILLAAERADEALAVLRPAWETLGARADVSGQLAASCAFALARALLRAGEESEGRGLLADAVERYAGLPLIDPADLELARQASSPAAG